VAGRPTGYVREERDGKLLCYSCDEWVAKEKFKPLRGKPHTQCNRCLYIKNTRPLTDKKMAEIHAYQLAQGCADCGYSSHPAALQFDHRPGEIKLFNIGEQVGKRSRAAIWAEIAKCDVVCANCHNIRTHERRTRVELVG